MTRFRQFTPGSCPGRDATRPSGLAPSAGTVFIKEKQIGERVFHFAVIRECPVTCLAWEAQARRSKRRQNVSGASTRFSVQLRIRSPLDAVVGCRDCRFTSDKIQLSHFRGTEDPIVSKLAI
ncbi:hypothetical protein GWI33_005318 [Rhynchophorus ferrugineus]|uniref:Uncharacterized protein n=1 Tax=Rhynchophorus ferrugineus TaxID=354439 RepID=A0A834ISQ0_RHYFE|nr:hypothetical protein GWI33_005318 [Rhynchophorus ferrugineus]